MSDTPGDERTLAGDIQRPVDVIEAEAVFTELSRQLTRRSRASGKQSSENEKGGTAHVQDLEKAHSDEYEETFDLREYLSSSNDATQAAGIKHKHVGVTWENLNVQVAGATGHKVGQSSTRCVYLFLPYNFTDRYTSGHLGVSAFGSL